MPGWSRQKLFRKPSAQRPDRAHQAPIQGRILELEEALGGGLGGLGLLPDLLELRAHRAAEVGQEGEMPPTPEQDAAELLLDLLHGPHQRRLGYVAMLRRAREVQGLAHREVADLVHFHGDALLHLRELLRRHQFDAI
jgi:hypothetical protein